MFWLRLVLCSPPIGWLEVDFSQPETDDLSHPLSIPISAQELKKLRREGLVSRACVPSFSTGFKQQPHVFNQPLVVTYRLVGPVYEIRAEVCLGWTVRCGSDEAPELLELDIWRPKNETAV
jgi:hypothetical protein